MQYLPDLLKQAIHNNLEEIFNLKICFSIEIIIVGWQRLDITDQNMFVQLGCVFYVNDYFQD